MWHGVSPSSLLATQSHGTFSKPRSESSQTSDWDESSGCVCVCGGGGGGGGG